MDNKTTYRKPETVTSPKERLEYLELIFDGGADSFSLAKIRWDGDECVGIRWNGNDNSIGEPNSFGNPTWFVIPEQIAPLIHAHFEATELFNKIKEG